MKGQNQLSTNVMIGIVLGVIILVIFFEPIVSYANVYFSSIPPCKETLTKNSFDQMISDSQKLEDNNPKTELVQIANKDCILVPFVKNKGNPSFLFPQECLSKSCLCLCNGADKSSCLSKPLCEEVGFESIKFSGFNNQYLQPDKTDYITEITLKKSGTELKVCSKESADCLPQLQIPQDIILSTQNYEFYIDLAHNAYPDVPINLIKAIITQESSGKYYSVSVGCGAAGLMQLMPGTAKDNGLSLIFEDSSITKCDSAYTSRLITKRDGILNNPLFQTDEQQKLQQLANIDDRFNPAKNIMAATKYLDALLKNPQINGDVSLALAAYNGGLGAISQSIQCPGELSYQCGLNANYQQTRDYVQKVLSYEQSYETTAAA